MTIYIYALIDPRTEEVRYIGKTINLTSRFRQHVYQYEQDNPIKNNWIKSLKQKGLLPKMIALEETTEDRWEEREIYWIAHGWAAGWNLTNLAAGGTGQPGGDNTELIARNFLDTLQNFTNINLRKLSREKVFEIGVKFAKEALDLFLIPFCKINGSLPTEEMFEAWSDDLDKELTALAGLEGMSGYVHE